MSKGSILISGPNVWQDQRLISLLKVASRVLCNRDNKNIEHILQRNEINAVIIEIPEESPGDVEFIKSANSEHQHIPFILIDGKRELIARAISYGVRDVFKRPYRGDLLAERVCALIGKSIRPS